MYCCLRLSVCKSAAYTTKYQLMELHRERMFLNFILCTIVELNVAWQDCWTWWHETMQVFFPPNKWHHVKAKQSFHLIRQIHLYKNTWVEITENTNTYKCITFYINRMEPIALQTTCRPAFTCACVTLPERRDVKALTNAAQRKKKLILN